MSLDVYLTLKGINTGHSGSGIFVRENGQVKEITRQEWDEKFPGREPVIAIGDDDEDEAYTANITHNLNRMANEAGIYEYLWKPDELGITLAAQLIEPLKAGLILLESDPVRFKEFNPSNGWGEYEDLVSFVRGYLRACEMYPTADVAVSR